MLHRSCTWLMWLPIVQLVCGRPRKCVCAAAAPRPSESSRPLTLGLQQPHAVQPSLVAAQLVIVRASSA